MCTSEHWTKVFQYIGVLLLATQAIFNLTMLDTCIVSYKNSETIRDNKEQFIKGIKADESGAHVDGKTYKIASEEIYYTTPSQGWVYDKKNLCVFRPYETSTILIQSGMFMVIGLLGGVCMRRRKRWLQTSLALQFIFLILGLIMLS